MFRHHALIEHLSANLHDFIHQISQNLSRPNKKFLRDGLIGLIRAGKPIVCQMARQLPNKRSKYLTRVKRLDEHLVSTGGGAGDDIFELDCGENPKAVRPPD